MNGSSSVKRMPNGSLASIDEVVYRRRLAQKRVDNKLTTLEQQLSSLHQQIAQLKAQMK